MSGFTSLRWQAGSRPGGRVTFFQRSQKKVTKKKASHVRAASRCLALLERWNTPEAASPPPPQGGDTSGPAKPGPRCPWQGLRFADLAPVACSLRSPRGGWVCLIPHASLLTRARHAVPLHLAPHSSRLTSHHGQPQGLPLHPHSYALTPHSYDLTPHPSPLTPHPSPLTPHPSPLTRGPSRK